MRRWRKSYPEAAAAHECRRTWTPEQRTIRNARAYVAVLVSCGKLDPAAYAQRGWPESRHTVPTWDDPAHAQ